VEKWNHIAKLLKTNDKPSLFVVEKAVQNLCKTTPFLWNLFATIEFSTGSTEVPQPWYVEKVSKSFYFSN